MARLGGNLIPGQTARKYVIELLVAYINTDLGLQYLQFHPASFFSVIS